ncbi:cytochrome P450 2F2-like isoform X2 [Protopterus annectens]|uniref:cytochrome P450 2F2-like isoform X2 n=2 Tax=Protopterus annectens TaxID=7888 RepID=UPI001CFC3D39|nr:cytochrome P450 2F2-like isoform X2 [Protopterus annectens]
MLKVTQKANGGERNETLYLSYREHHAMQYFWLALPIILVIGLLFHLWKRPRNFPPGPWTIPVFGNFLQLDYRNPLPDFNKLAKRYGNVFRIYLGSNPSVLLHGFETVKEALVNQAEAFAHRTKHPAMNIICNRKGLIMVPSGQHWKEHRRFCLMVLRNFGMGKKTMDVRIKEEITYFVRALEDQGDTPFDPSNLVNRTVGNIISSVLFGHRYDYEDHFFGQIIQSIHENMKMAFGMWGEIYNALPFLRCLPLPFQNMFKNSKIIQAFLKKEIEEHKESWIPNDPRDYTDCYLDELKKRNNDGSSFDEESLLHSLVDLLVGASDTVSSAVMWMILMMVTYPGIQAKCYNEIYSLEQSKTDGLCYEDKTKLPYIQAVLHEVLRFRTLVPVVLHGVSQEVTLSGYTIPKETRIMASLTSVLHDESQWKFPHEFNPSNFLNDKGEFVKSEAFMPFGGGPRSCLGENLARMELFLIFINLLKNFEFIWPDSSRVPDITPIFGTVISPQPFTVRVRQQQP